VRGLQGFIDVRPAGYCTLELSQASPTGQGRTVEILDLRVVKQIQTDDWGYLKIHRRKMEVDWYREMPRILEFCEHNKGETIQVVLVE
jgi:succinate dehydrogenase/fumarate reductase flavoprotein subunit